MPKVFASRSLMIHKPAADVAAWVRRFETWPQWWPVLVAAPGFELEFRDSGFSWAGKFCGEGRMQVLGEVADEGIACELTQLRPGKFKAGVAFRFFSKGDQTEVVWSFSGEVGSLLFWRKWSWQISLGEELERGLAMLKDAIETGVVRSRVEFPGLEGCPPFAGVGIRRTVALEDLERERNEDQRAVAEHYPEGAPITFYEKWCLRKRRVVYLTGVKLERMPGVVADGMTLIEFPGSEVFTVSHFGDRRHLGNAWAGGRMHLRVRHLKVDRKLTPFELSGRGGGEEEVVRICLPLK